MKTFVISTDFSSVATHAAIYGYQLARQVKADVVLCNAVTVPAEIPLSGVVVWPMEEYNVLMEESNNELKKLKHQLQNDVAEDSFHPSIKIINETGMLADVVGMISKGQKADLVIMGTHATSGFSHFLFGDHARKMIDSASEPLLIVPPSAKIKPVKKIAFATDFRQLDENLRAIYNLIPLARLMNAEILITSVYNEKYYSTEILERLKEFLVDISNKADYPHIYYRLVKNSNITSGLEWLCDHGDIDMMAMVHHQHNFFENVLKGSHTKRMADLISVPLLVIPGNTK